MIEARELSVSLGGRTILGPLSGELGAGVLLVAGPAQCGKTTLLKALCALVRPSAGSVTVDGVDLASSPEAAQKARSLLGMVFQNDALFDSLDATANVALPLLRRGVARPEALERAREALAQVGLAGHEQALPERLSGGMRKRLGLARAIVARPRYLLADDPFAGLDPGTVARMRDLLVGMWGGKGGLIMALADPAPMWEVCTEALILDGGKVAARGEPRQVRGEARVASLFGEAAA
ncbi:MAG: ATP-binding cassette domain-containing protein [Deltaproteobacteria bacterium]|nr:ATP-binding cassette domain-containing protein [Deltaproteobacteria bacterium]